MINMCPRGRYASVPLLELKQIAKHFGAIEAIAGVDLAMERGEVVGLMGDNGAGKSTLVKIIAGGFPPSSGQLFVEDRLVRFTKPIDARNQGIEVVYQDLALCDNLSSSANIFLARERKRWLGPFRLLHESVMHRRSGELFVDLKSETRPHDLVRQMSGGQRQAVAIARSLLSQAKVLLLDEPTAAISVRQIVQVLDLIRRIRDQGIAVVLVSHRMPDVFAVADRLVVLRRGRKVADKPIATSSPEEVTGLITGALDAA